MVASQHNGTWTMDHAEYMELAHAARKLAALEAAGVDNWIGYDDAMAAYREEYGEDA